MKNIIPIMVVFAILLVPTGFAVAYNGTAVTSCGSLDGSCIVVESYIRDGDDYISSPILTEKALVTKNNNNTYTMSASNVELTPADLYLKVSGIGYDGSVTLSCTATVTGIGSCTFTLDGTSFTSRTVSQGYHGFSVLYTGSYNGSTMPESEVELTISATASSVGSMINGSDALRLKASSASSVLEIMEDNNPDIVASDDYQFSTTTSTNHGNNYPAVGIQNENNNQGGISDNSGNIDVEITVPAGPQFVLYLRTSGSNTFQLTMSKGGEVLISGTVTFNSGIGTSGYYLSSYSYDGSSSGYFYSSINNVNTYNAWMSGDSDDISIVIVTEDGQSASRNLKMDIVFKKET